MKRYEVKFNELLNDGILSIDFVDNPATGQMFVALSEQGKEAIKMASVDEKEYIVAGVALRPNQDILRYNKQTNEHFYITFSNETVKELCYAFTKNKFNSNAKEEHDPNRQIEGVTFVENWIVRDETKDTALALGLEVKNGDWVTVAKCDNKDVYNKALNGEFNGFSIEAMLPVKEINFKSEIKMSETMETGFAKLKEEMKLWLSEKFGKKEEPTEEVKPEVEVQAEVTPEVVEEPKEEKIEMSAILNGVDGLLKVALTEQSKIYDAKLEEQSKVIKGLEEKVIELSNEPAAMPTKSQPIAEPKTAKERILNAIRTT